MLTIKPDLKQPGNYFKLFYKQIVTRMASLLNGNNLYQAVSAHLDFKTGLTFTLKSENELVIRVNEHILNSI